MRYSMTGHAGMLALLLAGTALTVLPQAAIAQAQTVLDIPAQPLARALIAFSNQTGIEVFAASSATAGLISVSVQGPLTPDAALARMLGGTGLDYSFDGTRSVSIRAPRDAGVMLGTIVVAAPDGAFWDGSAASVYSTPASVTTIGTETLANYQLTNPADILRGTTGVLSGEARNSGSLNVNIHGMQGMGRVPVTVDGAENAAVVYRGYQGASDRTFVDSDFISSVAINRGPSTGSGGIGGSVAVTTVTPDDILLPGRTSGWRFQTSLSGNTTEPQIGKQAAITGGAHGMEWPNVGKRPSLLNPTADSTSLTYARLGEKVDIVAGYSYRDLGNYFAGSEGPVAEQGFVECSEFNFSFYCSPGHPQIDNVGITPYAADEEVLNTSAESRSALVKATFHLSEDLEWQLGYSHYETTFGETFP